MGPDRPAKEDLLQRPGELPFRTRGLYHKARRVGKAIPNHEARLANSSAVSWRENSASKA